MSPGIGFLGSAIKLAQFVCAMLIITWALPHQNHFALRLAGVLGASVALSVLFVWVGFVWQPWLMELEARPITELLFFSATLAFSTLMLLLLYDTNAWVALALVTASYTIENLASAVIGLTTLVLGLTDAGQWGELILFAAITAGVYICCYVLLARPLRRLESTGVENHRMVIGVGALLLALVAFDSVNQLLPTLEVRFADCIVLRMVQGICCIFLLCCEYEIFYNKALKASVVTLGRARADEAKSYAISQANANAINVKMHDLRHRLRDLDALGYVGPDELENLIESLNVYDASFKTGNDALDTVLTEKGLICEQSDIALGCIANGSVLSFMAPADIYAFFSSAIDNAIEAVQKFRATEHRIIDVTVKRSGDMAVIHVENYYKTDPNPESRAGRQRESIGRGYGMRHMRAVIERYGGALTTSVDGGLFRLDAIIPLPEGFDPNGTKETRHAAPRGSMP